MSTCDLYLGRFQPFHNGHLAAVNQMRGIKVIAVVKGKQTKKSDNPIPTEAQVNMIKKVIGDTAVVIAVPNGYVPDIIETIRDQYGLEPTGVICGSDRIGEYKAQIERANRTLEKVIKLEFKEADRITSGSEVREAIRSGDRKAFEANVPKQLWDEFTNLAEYMRGQ